MTDQEMELRLKTAVEACTPEVLDKVLEKCDSYKEDKKIPNVVPFQRKGRYYSILAACVLLFLIVGGGYFATLRLEAKKVASIVSVEINPSIELKINADGEVLEAIAVNADAEVVLGKMKLVGTDIYTATNAIVGSLLKHGYIDELANSILISVEDTDSTRGNRLQDELSNEMNAILEAASINASILSQYIDGEKVDAVSQQYDISHGKAALIEEIMAGNPNYVFEELAKLSVNELNLIMSNSKNQVDDVKTMGEATDHAYIGSEKANQIAFGHAKVEAKNVRELETELDYEYHKMVYEVEFICNGAEYEYNIDAMTGEIIEYQAEEDD